MRYISLFLLFWLLGVEAFCQTTAIHYDNDNRITMLELATHYRICTVDTVVGGFVGGVREFLMNDSLICEMSYSSSGLKEGAIKIYDGEGHTMLTGQYADSRKIGKWKIGVNREIDFNQNRRADKRVDSV